MTIGLPTSIGINDMPVNRDAAARTLYLFATRTEREEMVRYSQCDEGRDVGLLRGYMASDFENLARVRKRKAASRAEKVKRKADFYFILARMVERSARLEVISR